MPTYVHGRVTNVLVDSYDLTSYFREASRSSSVETAETTTYGTFDKTYVVGFRDSTLSLGGVYDGTANAVDQVLNTVLGRSTPPVVTVALHNSAWTIGGAVYTGKAHETSYQVQSPLSDMVSVSADFQSDGGIFSGIALTDFSSVSATTTSTGVDNTAATTTGWLAALHVTANTRSTTSVVKLQDSADGSSWTDVTGGTFATVAISGTTQEVLRSATGATLRRYVRAVNTLAAGTGSIKYMVSVCRLPS